MLGALMYVFLWIPLQFARRFLWRWHIEGRENLPPLGQGMILVVNHLNWTDIHIVGASLPLTYRPAWIAKIEIFINPFVVWWLRTMQVIPIHRGQRDMRALADAEAVLRRHKPLIIFPEGHRSDTGGLLEGHGGAIRLAARTGCPIVPIAVWGTETGLRGAVRGQPIHVRIGEPYTIAIEGQKIPWNLMQELTEDMMVRIAVLMPERYWGHYHDHMLHLG